MLLKRLVLKNIRSYKETDLSFPEGILLLAGDIGSGKSTILYAVEFALFGIQRGELTGAALLRNGSNNGSVKLTFVLGEKEYTIKRTLKRSSQRVDQGPGYLEYDGKRSELTPTELKSRVLTLLGYPEQLLNRKALVYRFTVYTPQENMKHILEQDTEERLKILRTVFDVDKYQVIKENASTYAKTLRDRVKHLEGQIHDIGLKKEQRDGLHAELEKADAELKKLEPLIYEAKKNSESERKELEKIEKSKTDWEDLRNQVQIEETKLESLNRELAKAELELGSVSKKISELGESETDLKDVGKDVKQKESVLEKLEDELASLRSKNTEHSVKRKHAQETAKKISELSHCPLCLQDVNQEHKSKIIAEQKLTLKSVYEQEIAVSEQIKQSISNIASVRKELADLREAEKMFEVKRMKNRQLEDLKLKKADLLKEIEQIKANIDCADKLISDLGKQIVPLTPLVAKHNEIKQKFEKLLRDERNLEVQLAMHSSKRELTQKQIAVVDEEINRREFARLKLEKVKKTHFWLSDEFVPLMDEIERHVLAKIHEDFDDAFKEWFSMLVDDSLMTARLDDTFSPLIQQNGYETEIQFLSGGERTACALAYRLALNNTVNGLLNTIKTKDLLILDEPTDGFSAEQLDRMRDVLEQLKLKQVVIVSHEQKIESFAQNTIRVEKSDHSSQVFA